MILFKYDETFLHDLFVDGLLCRHCLKYNDIIDKTKQIKTNQSKYKKMIDTYRNLNTLR